MRRKRKWVCVDLFAGGGGGSEGIRRALGVSPRVAIDHDAGALEMHAANHAGTEHLVEDVRDVSPAKIRARLGSIDLLWASPDCKDFSRAKGGKPRDANIRSLAWVVVDWARDARPEIICLENVLEFLDWGPLDEQGRRVPARKGEEFRAFVAALRSHGYAVEWRPLVAADYGAPTSRRRLFMIARCDGVAISWPEPSHGPGAEPYLTAADCVDWGLELPSIFGRAVPLVPATHRRLAEGFRRYVTVPDPYLGDGYGDPFAPALVQVSYGERPGQRPRALDLHAPLGAVVAGGVKHAIGALFLAKHFGGPNGKQPPGLPMTAPFSAITTKDHHALVGALVSGRDRREETAAWFAEHGLGEPSLRVGGERVPILDVGMRRFVARELARGQGFADSYVLTGTPTQQVARMGNAVPPAVVEAIVSRLARAA